MDGPHDLGGKPGFGAVVREADEPVFHEPWEATAWALNVLALQARVYTTDAYRHAVERLEPSWYLSSRYYERWLTGVTTLMVERGVVTIDELEHRAGGRYPLAGPVAALPPLPTERIVSNDERFAVGDDVVVVARTTPGHTRCPAYVRDRPGTVVRVYPLTHYPESRARTAVMHLEHSYGVEFAASDLWPEGDRDQTVVVDLFESYLARR